MQGRYMLTFLLPMLLMLTFFLFTLYFASQSILTTTTRIIKEEIDTKVAVQFQDQGQPTVEAYAALVKSIKSYIRDFSTNLKYRKALLSSLLWIFGAGIFLIIVQLSLMTVFFSHKLAGPLYRLEKACHNVIEGDYTEKISLRKGDEMQNLANLFNEMIVVTNERIQNLRDADAPGKKEEILSSLKL
jgi:nitrogen fixation/metabolism regulation signal transduction histidine kinase